jgi:hypothetical protein
LVIDLVIDLANDLADRRSDRGHRAVRLFAAVAAVARSS